MPTEYDGEIQQWWGNGYNGNLRYAVVDQDGKTVNIGTTIIISEDELEDVPFETKYGMNADIFNKAVIEAKLCGRFVTGMFDTLFGHRWTPAARRYIRHTKRVKEKMRRQKLKEVRS